MPGFRNATCRLSSAMSAGWPSLVEQLNRLHEEGFDALIRALIREDGTRVTRASLRDVFEAEGFEFGEPSVATAPPQQVGQKATTVIALVGFPAAITRVEFTINAVLAMWMLTVQRVPR